MTRSTIQNILRTMLASTLASMNASAFAATIVVTTLDDTGAGSLRDSITTANPGDTITLASGLSGSIVLGTTLLINKNLSIIGNSHVILDGNDSVRVLTVTSGTQVNLDRLLIQRGSANDGGGIFSDGVLRISQCVIRNNHATDRGGGLFVNSGNFTLIDTQVIDNESMAEGGGIVDFGSSASIITDSTITGNLSGGPGGGIRHVSGQPLSIAYSTVSGNQIVNTALISGGGISSQSGVLNVSYSTVSANKAHFAGGIMIQNIGAPATLNLTASLIAGNTAVSDGGGLFVFGATLNSMNSSIANNLAGAGTGGGIAMQNSSAGNASATLINSTVAFNRANSNGGGITLITGGLNLKNTLIAGNTASANPDLLATFTSLGYNLVQTRGTSSGYLASDLANGSNPMLAIVAFNGGPTNALRLQAGSAAINAIPAASCSGISLDQRGYRRPASNCDIGAYEVEGVAIPINVFASGFE
jgi:hypothetical protein